MVGYKNITSEFSGVGTTRLVEASLSAPSVAGGETHDLLTLTPPPAPPPP